MPESLEGFSEIHKLRQEVEDLRAISGAVLRNLPDLAAKTLAAVRADPATARIILLVDGARSQNEIRNMLVSEGFKGASLSGVSARFDKLANDLGLIALVERNKAGKIYRRTILDRELKISQTLERLARSGK
jgi:hypothetical protein